MMRATQIFVWFLHIWFAERPGMRLLRQIGSEDILAVTPAAAYEEDITVFLIR